MITINATGDTTLYTAGKYCEEDILVKVPEAGVELPELTNEGSANDLLLGKELIDDEGNKVTGTMPNNGAISKTFDGLNTKSYTIPAGYTTGGTVSLDNTINNEVDEQADLIAQIKSAVDNLPEAGSGEGNLNIETCTVSINRHIGGLYVTTYVDGEVVLNGGQLRGDALTINNVICGSGLFLISTVTYSPIITGATINYHEVNSTDYYITYATITAKSGETVTIN